MLIKILLGLAALAVVLIVIVATRPAAFRIQRSTRIAAPHSAAFAVVNNFHRWTAWSPWEKMDPNLQRAYEGPESGPGAVYRWSGNKKVGEGRMTIENSSPEKIVIKLEFLKPFKATNTATFTFTPDAGGTHVTWTMDGRNNFMAKAFHMLMDMDKLVGNDFEKGLAAMRTEAEKTSLASARN
jgi:hypothetical protein